jgi:hypothetical protein
MCVTIPSTASFVMHRVPGAIPFFLIKKNFNGFLWQIHIFHIFIPNPPHVPIRKKVTSLHSA